MSRAGAPHHKVLFGAKVKHGAELKDAQGAGIGKYVTDGSVDVEADTPALSHGHGHQLVYTWGHGKHGGEASGYLLLPGDFAHPHVVAHELRAKQKADHQPGDHALRHAPKPIARWKVTPVEVPDDVYIDRPSEPGVRERLKTFAPGTRLDLCHNVPNQRGGGGVIIPLVADMKFFQVHGSVSQPVYRQDHPRDKGHHSGYAHWIQGYVKAGHPEKVLEGWVLLHVDRVEPQLTRLS